MANFYGSNNGHFFIIVEFVLFCSCATSRPFEQHVTMKTKITFSEAR